MAKKKSPSSGNLNTLSTLAIFVLFLGVVSLFYLNSQIMKRLDEIDKSYSTLVNHVTSAEIKNQNRADLNNGQVTAIEQTGSSKEVQEAMTKVLGKRKFKIEGILFCTLSSDDTDDISIESLLFNTGVVSYYITPRNTHINTKTIPEGRGKYKRVGLDIPATISIETGKIQILNFKIADLSNDKTKVLGISLLSGAHWTIADCKKYGITYGH